MTRSSVMPAASFLHEDLGQTAADAEDQEGGGGQQQEDGQQLITDEGPVLHDAHGRRHEHQRHDGDQEGCGILYLLCFYDAQTKGEEQKRQSPDGTGDGQRQQPLQGFAGHGEAENDAELR